MTTPLLNIEDIATWHKCSRRHACDVIVKPLGFPAEAPTSTPRCRVWVTKEVLAFATKRTPGPHALLKAA